MTITAGITALGGYVPGIPVLNMDLPKSLNSDDQWITRRTGIKSRHFARDEQATGDLAIEAARRALLDWGGPPVDQVIVATTTPDRRLPGTAPRVAAELGLGQVPATDIAAVCSGFVYGLVHAAAFVRSGFSRATLVIGAEKFSTILDPQDRTTSVLFGDGAGAVVVSPVEPGEPGQIITHDHHSDGTQTNLITVPSGGAEHPLSPGLLGRAAEKTRSQYFQMAGSNVFAAAVTRMTESVAQVLMTAAWEPSSVKRLVAHQANARILAKVADLAGMETDVAWVHVDRVGNTSAASIPLAMCDAVRNTSPGDRTVLTAFGGGTTWGSLCLLWPDVARTASNITDNT